MSIKSNSGKPFELFEFQVIGKARGGLGRVGDYYTRDRSTPRLDADFVSWNFCPFVWRVFGNIS